MTVRIGGVLLAAGRSRRFGSDKRMARLSSGETVLDRAVAAFAPAVDELVLVIGAADEPGAFAARFPGLKIFRARDSAAGMGSSLAEAIRAAPAWNGCLVGLADMPFISSATVLALRAAMGEEIVVPRFRGQWGHPVGFPHRVFAALSALHGEVGARALILAESARCRFLDVDDQGVLADVDTPEALRAAEAACAC
jgi:molybdenum cofactor cytidylyltransferase